MADANVDTDTDATADAGGLADTATEKLTNADKFPDATNLLLPKKFPMLMNLPNSDAEKYAVAGKFADTDKYSNADAKNFPKPILIPTLLPKPIPV